MEQSLLLRAEEIAEKLNQIIQRDKSLDESFEQEKDKIEKESSYKIESFHYDVNSRIKRENTRVGDINIEIKKGIAELDRAITRLPDKVRYTRDVTNVKPAPPDFQALNELLARINDESFNGKMKRVFNLDGYSFMSDLVGEYLDRIESGKKFLLSEKKKNENYLKNFEEAEKQKFYKFQKDVLREKQEKLEKAKNNHYLEGQKLQVELNSTINDNILPDYNRDLVNLLSKMGGIGADWDNYQSINSYPEQLMIGSLQVPFIIPNPYNQMIKEKMPVAYSSGRNFLAPVTMDASKPLQLAICYDKAQKNVVMEGVQSIILKWIRFMPMYSFSITYIDPNDRGSNLGKLQKLEEISAWDICKQVYTSREDISNRLKEIEKFIDTTCSQLAGIDSVYEYNANTNNPIIQHLIVVNDYSADMDRSIKESLEVIIRNSNKCGISIIFTKDGSVTEFPEEVRYKFAKINAVDGRTTILYNGKMYDFAFNHLIPSCDGYIESVKTAYQEGLKVDNSFSSHFSTEEFKGYRESTDCIRIPFAVDSKNNPVELELGGALSAHALLSGTTGSGKSTTLHIIINSIILNYHPDDVELWLVDYNKVEFADYVTNRPPHIKLIGLERGNEFTFSLLEKIDAECQRRMDLFKQVGVNDITGYKKKFGVNSLPRIVLIVDEFHQMTQAVQSEFSYVTVLENILSEYRKFGLSCLFSDQAISTGLRGLTDKGKKQIRTRLAMSNESDEIIETLSVESSYYRENFANKVERMSSGDVIFKQTKKDSAGDTQTVFDMCRSIYMSQEDKFKCAAFAYKQLEDNYEKTDVMIVDGKGRGHYNEDIIRKYEITNGCRRVTDVPIYVGTPANLDPCFRFIFENQMDSNVMLIGSDTEIRASILMSTIRSFMRVADCEVVVFADKYDELYTRCVDEIKEMYNSRIRIIINPEDLCGYVNGLFGKARTGETPKTLLVWLGLEAIGDDLSMYPEKREADSVQSSKNKDTIMSSLDNIDALLAERMGYSDESVESDGNIDSKDSGAVYDARNDITELISKGSRFGIHNFVSFMSVKILRKARFIKLESFEHRIALQMGRDDWSSFMERTPYIPDLDRESAVYFDGGSSSHVFRPYLLDRKET